MAVVAVRRHGVHADEASHAVFVAVVIAEDEQVDGFFEDRAFVEIHFRQSGGAVVEDAVDEVFVVEEVEVACHEEVAALNAEVVFAGDAAQIAQVFGYYAWFGASRRHAQADGGMCGVSPAGGRDVFEPGMCFSGMGGARRRQPQERRRQQRQ